MLSIFREHFLKAVVLKNNQILKIEKKE